MVIEAGVLRGIGAALNAGGAILLAIRVSVILHALGNVAGIHEQNIEEVVDELAGKHSPGRPLLHARGATRWIKRSQGLCLLGFGFLLIIAGAACQFAAAFI